jgi:hypothetical protein
MGEFSTEVGRPTRLHRGAQAWCCPATAEGRKDPGGGLARAGHPAQRGAAVEAALRRGRHRGRRHERGRRPGECPAGSPSADSRTRAAARQEADGDRDPAGRAGGRKKKSVVAQRVRTVPQHPVAAICRTLRMAQQTAVLRRPGAAGRLLSAARRRDGASADPRRHEQPGSPRVGQLQRTYGEGGPGAARRARAKNLGDAAPCDLRCFAHLSYGRAPSVGAISGPPIADIGASPRYMLSRLCEETIAGRHI